MTDAKLRCDNGDGADIAGAVGKQNGVTVLEGKRHASAYLLALDGPKTQIIGDP